MGRFLVVLFFLAMAQAQTKGNDAALNMVLDAAKLKPRVTPNGDAALDMLIIKQHEENKKNTVAQCTDCDTMLGKRTPEKMLDGVSHLLACYIYDQPSVIESVVGKSKERSYLYPKVVCDVDGKGNIQSVKAVVQKFQRSSAEGVSGDYDCSSIRLSPDTRYRLSGSLDPKNHSIFNVQMCGIRTDLTSSVGTCGWCPARRTVQSVQETMTDEESIVEVVVKTNLAVEKPSQDQKGTTRSYSGPPVGNGNKQPQGQYALTFESVVKNAKKNDAQCDLKKLEELRQEVTQDNSKPNDAEGTPCRNVLEAGFRWRVSGICKGGIFFANPCGLVEKVAKSS